MTTHYGPGPMGNNTNSLRRLYHRYGRNRGRSLSGKNRFHRVRSPKGAPGSDEALLYSGNILYDPGFELFVQNAAPTFLKPGWSDWTGSECYVLPRFDITRTPTGQRWPNGDTVSHFDIAQWAQYTEPYELQGGTKAVDGRESSAWFVVRREVPSQTDFTTAIGPNLGVFVARWYGWESSAQFPLGNGLPGGLIIQGPGMPPGYSGRTEDGAFITWSAHVWVSPTSVLLSAGSPVVNFSITFYNQGGSPIFTTTSSSSLSTSKTEYSLSSNSPGGSYFMRAAITFSGTANRSTIVNVDSGLLGVE